MNALVAWTLTTGAAGMRTQARGLAEAVADTVIEKTITVGAPWSWLPAGALPFALRGVSGDPVAPPWPDLVVSCGRKSAIAAAAIRKASGGRTVVAHVQDPLADPKRFDLVVALPHDRVKGPNVLNVLTALHDVTPAKLEAAADAWRERFAPLGKPLVGVILGGATRGRDFTVEDGQTLIDRLQAMRAESGAGLAITPSRRTPEAVRALFRQAFADDPRVFVWDLNDPNPYRGILALADRLVVTSDSLSMVSEAISTPHPVEVFDLELEGGRHAGFLQNMLEAGLVRRFEGEAEPPTKSTAKEATRQAADAVKAILAKRGV
ncbi:MAG: mitochondrial fission ELM1 family protein [Proteobacteria bacterium]|nr:mitochondrial fission ELM1 family protein [Pseudomonadota bacterium]